MDNINTNSKYQNSFNIYEMKNTLKEYECKNNKQYTNTQNIYEMKNSLPKIFNQVK